GAVDAASQDGERGSHPRAEPAAQRRGVCPAAARVRARLRWRWRLVSAEPGGGPDRAGDDGRAEDPGPGADGEAAAERPEPAGAAGSLPGRAPEADGRAPGGADEARQ